MKEITFVITENTEPINALKMMKSFVEGLEQDLYNWKWIVIASHNCIQNFMVSALRSGNNLNVLENNSADNWFAEFTKRMKSKIEDWKSPKEKLDYFPNLYKKVTSDKMLMYTISKKLETDKNKEEAIEWLNWQRNKFIHFVPSTFLINAVHFPKRMLVIMDIIKFLVKESGNIIWTDSEDKNVTVKLIDELTESFQKLNDNYTSEKDAT